jgi:hypothetical protein
VGSNKLVQFSASLTPEAIAPADRKEGKGSALLFFALPQGAELPAVAEAENKE